MSAWSIYAWSEANYFVPVTSLAERLPVYKGFTAKRQLARMGLVDLKRDPLISEAAFTSGEDGDRQLVAPTTDEPAATEAAPAGQLAAAPPGPR